MSPLLVLTTRLLGRGRSVCVTHLSTAAAMADWTSGLMPDMDSTALEKTYPKLRSAKLEAGMYAGAASTCYCCHDQQHDCCSCCGTHGEEAAAAAVLVAGLMRARVGATLICCCNSTGWRACMLVPTECIFGVPSLLDVLPGTTSKDTKVGATRCSRYRVPACTRLHDSKHVSTPGLAVQLAETGRTVLTNPKRLLTVDKRHFLTVSRH